MCNCYRKVVCGVWGTMSRALSVHQEHELLLALEKAGIVSNEAQAVITSKKNQLAEGMLAWLREQLTPSTSSTPGLFSTPQEVLSRFVYYAIHQAGWDFGSGWLEQLEDQMPVNHVSNLNHLLTLDIWLGDLPTTFEALASWIEYEQLQAGNGYWRWDELKSDTKHLRLLDPERYGTAPSVRWVELDMLANRGSSPKEVRDPKKSAGLQVLSGFAVHPAYPPAINYETIPGAWAASLQAAIPGVRAWTSVPILDWLRTNRRVILLASWDDRRGSSFAVPVVRDCSSLNNGALAPLFIALSR